MDRRVRWSVINRLIFNVFTWMLLSTNFAFAQVDQNSSEKSETSISVCMKTWVKEEALQKDPGFYYFASAICKLSVAHDAVSFNQAVQDLHMSASYSFPLSYYAMGVLFQEKYKLGSKFYGAVGKPSDLLEAIENYEKASDFGSSLAEYQLGIIYLDEINFTDGGQREKPEGKVKNSSLKLPNVNQAVYWLTRSAKNGNANAQAVLSDLYKQGIGVPQDYVLAYVWKSLFIASWPSFNDHFNDEIIQKIFRDEIKNRDELYLNFTDAQKDKAGILLEEYQKNYFHVPTGFDSACKITGNIIIYPNFKKLTNLISRELENLKNE